MPNRIIGKILSKVVVLINNLKRAIKSHINYALIGKIEKPFDIHFSVEIRTPKQVKIGKDCTVKNGTIMNGRSTKKEFGITLGENTYFKENCYIDAYGGFINIKGKCAFGQNTNMHGGGGIDIGENVIFGANCYIVASNHNFRSKELPIMLQGDYQKGIKIGNNVWLGGSVIILDGVTIGNNCVIGAGSVITKNILSNTKIICKNQQIEEIIYE